MNLQPRDCYALPSAWALEIARAVLPESPGIIDPYATIVEHWPEARKAVEDALSALLEIENGTNRNRS